MVRRPAPETGSPQLVGHEGLLLGWYVTGDVAAVDGEGFLFSTGRPPALASVIANPDEDRGEKLIALYQGSALNPAELAQALAACDLPKLWLPK